MNLKEAFAMAEGSSNPDYKRKTGTNMALTHVNLKGGKYASAGDAGLHSVAKALFNTRTRYRGSHSGKGGYTRKGQASGAAVYTTGEAWRKGGKPDVKQPGKDY
jgi:stalled ribosome alternative rescue factor ArfA